MKIIINERQYKKIFLSGKYDSLLTEDIAPVSIAKNIGKELISITDDIGDHLDDVKKVFGLTRGSTWDDLGRELINLKTFTRPQIKSLLTVNEYGIAQSVLDFLKKDEGFLLQVAGYKKAVMDADQIAIGTTKKFLSSILPENLIEDFVETTAGYATKLALKKVKQEKILKAFESLDVKGKEEYINSNYKQFDEAGFNEVQIERLIKGIVTPDFSEMRTLLKEWHKNKLAKPFIVFAQDNGYTLPKTLTTFLKKSSARSINKLFEILGKSLTWVTQHPWITAAFAASVITGAWGWLYNLKGWRDEIMKDVVKEVKDILNQAEVFVNDENITINNPNLNGLNVSKYNDDVAYVDPGIKIGGKTYNYFKVIDGKLITTQPQGTGNLTLKQRSDKFKIWFENSGEWSDKSGVVKTISELSDSNKKLLTYGVAEGVYTVFYNKKPWLTYDIKGDTFEHKKTSSTIDLDTKVEEEIFKTWLTTNFDTTDIKEYDYVDGKNVTLYSDGTKRTWTKQPDGTYK